MTTEDEERAFNVVRDKLAETQADLRVWIARVQRVRELHVGQRRRLTWEVSDEHGGGTASQSVFVCVVCTPNRNIDGDQRITPWPCPTITALDSDEPS